MSDPYLGRTLIDQVTGFTGVATGHASYLTGCDQYCLTPAVKPDGDLPLSQWFDVTRLAVNAMVEPITLLNPDATRPGGPNGPGSQAPTR